MSPCPPTALGVGVLVPPCLPSHSKSSPTDGRVSAALGLPPLPLLFPDSQITDLLLPCLLVPALLYPCQTQCFCCDWCNPSPTLSCCCPVLVTLQVPYSCLVHAGCLMSFRQITPRQPSFFYLCPIKHKQFTCGSSSQCSKLPFSTLRLHSSSSCVVGSPGSCRFPAVL